MIAMTRQRPTAPLDPRALARTRIGLSEALRGLSERDRGTRWIAIGFAAVLHAGLFTAVAQLPVVREAPPKITEVELAPPPPEPPPPPKPEEPEKVAEPPVKERAAAPPPVARAGNVLTARSDTPAAADAVDFVTDPEGKSFGSGIVARGGTLDHGSVPTPLAPRGPTTVRGASGAAGGGDGVTTPENLSRAARLDEANPCAGFYPRTASADVGQVTLAVVVRATGELASSVVVSETPAGEGFGAAARACLARKTFAPAADKQGRAVTAALALRVKFTR